MSSDCSNNLFLSLYNKHFLLNEKWITIRMKAVIYLQVKHVKYAVLTRVACSRSSHDVEMHFKESLNQSFRKIIYSIK